MLLLSKEAPDVNGALGFWQKRSDKVILMQAHLTQDMKSSGLLYSLDAHTERFQRRVDVHRFFTLVKGVTFFLE